MTPGLGRVERLGERRAVGLTELAVDTLELVRFEQRRSAVDRGVQCAHQLVRVLARAPDVSDRTQCGDVRKVDIERALPRFERFVVAVQLLRKQARTPS